MPELKSVYRHTSAFNEIEVTDLGFIRVLSFDGHRQSSMYLDSPFDTAFEYPSYFHIVLAIDPDASRALAIGLGGGTVVKRMWRDYRDMHVDAVEMDPDVVDVARRYFALPDDERIRVFVGEGRSFLESSRDDYDIVIVDAFDGDVIPAQLADRGFMQTLRARMSAGGAVAYNFMGALEGEASGPFAKLHATLSEAWRHVWVFAVDEGVEDDDLTNLVLVSSDAPVTTDVLLRRIAGRVDGRVSVPAFHLFGNDLWRGETH